MAPRRPRHKHGNEVDRPLDLARGVEVKRAPGYLETLLLQDHQEPRRMLTVDRWESSDAFDAFLRTHQGDYERLDRACEQLSTSERRVGAYWELLSTDPMRSVEES